MTFFLNILLVIVKIILIPIMLLLFIIGLLSGLLLSLAKGFVIIIFLLCILILGVLLYFNLADLFGIGWNIMSYPTTALIIIMIACLFPTIIKTINKKLLSFMTLWA